VPRDLFAADHGQAEQIVAAAAVDADRDHLAALEQRLESSFSSTC
jgi:hypothetical protein